MTRKELSGQWNQAAREQSIGNEARRVGKQDRESDKSRSLTASASPRPQVPADYLGLFVLLLLVDNGMVRQLLSLCGERRIYRSVFHCSASSVGMAADYHRE